MYMFPGLQNLTWGDMLTVLLTPFFSPFLFLFFLWVNHFIEIEVCPSW